MTARRFAACLLLLPLALLCVGCALRPDHLTIYAERSETETPGDRKGRTVGTKEGVSVSFKLTP